MSAWFNVTCKRLLIGCICSLFMQWFITVRVEGNSPVQRRARSLKWVRIAFSDSRRQRGQAWPFWVGEFATWKWVAAYAAVQHAIAINVDNNVYIFERDTLICGKYAFAMLSVKLHNIWIISYEWYLFHLGWVVTLSLAEVKYFPPIG